MTLRKITVDNSVRYIPKSEQIKDKNIKPKTIKAGSPHVNRTKIFHKRIKSFLIKFQHQDSNKLQNSICTCI